MAEHQKFYWNELLTDNVPKAKAFYQSVVGWEFEEMNMGPDSKYTVAKTKSGPVGGMMDKSATGSKNAPSAWMSYIHVDNVDAAVAKVAGAGGKVLQPCFDVPGVGRIAMI